MKKKLSSLFRFINKCLVYILKNTVDLQNQYKRVSNSRYGRLVRMSSYHVYPMLLLPVLWAVWMAGESLDLSDKIAFSALFTMGTFLARSIGCIINDIADINFDKKVIRTKSRSIASGEVSIHEAISVAGVMTTLAVIILLSLPSRVIYIGIITAIMICIYPLSKRFTNVPQLILGLTFNLGVLIGWLTVSNEYFFQMIMLYIGSAMFTFGYDTVYACQDIEDDEAAGIKSFPLFIRSQGREIKPVVWHLYKVSMTCIGIAGLGMGMGLSFYLALGSGAYVLYNTIEDCNLNSPASCADHFKKTNIFLFLVFLGIIFS